MTRFLLVLLVGPFLARFIAKHSLSAPTAPIEPPRGA